MKKNYEAPVFELFFFEPEEVLSGESGLVVRINPNLAGGKEMDSIQF